MKRKIFCCLLALLSIINFAPVNAVKNNQTNPCLSCLDQLMATVAAQPVCKIVIPKTLLHQFRKGYRTTARAVTKKTLPVCTSKEKTARATIVSTPNCEEIIYTAYQNVIIDKFRKEIEAVMAMVTRAEPQPPAAPCSSASNAQKILGAKDRYSHNAYSTFGRFFVNWQEFDKYFSTLVEITDYDKYVSYAANKLTLQANETIREFMKPSEYLSEVEKLIFSGETFNSQVVSEVLSGKMSELGFENYILQLSPGYTGDDGQPKYNNGVRYLLLYRGYKNNWFIADFSLAMEYKYYDPQAKHNSICIPFSEYINTFINFLKNSHVEWYTQINGQMLHNAFIINFVPGFYDRSDEYYFADISYLPIDLFVEYKKEIEETHGLDQYAAEIKKCLINIKSIPNYTVIFPDQDTVEFMHEYMINYLTLP